MANEIQKTNGGASLATQAVTGITKAAEHETAISSAAAQAQATIQARYVMAYQRPRDMDDVRAKLIKACKRPRFAETAVYRKPMGKKKNDRGQWEQQYIEGPSVRFAEEAARALGNISVESPTLYDDFEKRIVAVQVTDLESNTVYSTSITIQKTVERKTLKDGQTSLGSRLNSYGDVVYLVEATDDEMMVKQGALVSKERRNLTLKLLPSDIKEEAIEQAYVTVNNADAVDPDAARKRISDSFAAINVPPSELKKYLGHTLETCSPAELNELRKVYAAIKEGETTWGEELKLKLSSDQPAAQGNATAGTDAAKTRTQAAKDAVKAKARTEEAASAGANPQTGEFDRGQTTQGAPAQQELGTRQPGEDDKP